MIRPAVQLAAAVAVVLFGAWLIGWWMVGVVVVLFGVGLGVDAVLRHDGPSTRDMKQKFSDEVLERYRRAR